MRPTLCTLLLLSGCEIPPEELAPPPPPTESPWAMTADDVRGLRWTLEVRDDELRVDGEVAGDAEFDRESGVLELYEGPLEP